MNKNYMEQVADMLNVELNEEFYMQHVEENEVPTNAFYKLTYNGLYEHIDNEWMYCYALPSLLMGEYKIVKKPFVPKVGDKYYCIGFDKYCLNVTCTIHCNTSFDYIRIKVGIVYSTHQECEENLANDYKKLTNKNIQEDYEYINDKWTYKKNNEKEM